MRSRDVAADSHVDTERLSALYLLVTQLWGEMLGIAPIERGDRFRELGGTSLLGEALVHRLSRGLGCTVSAEVIMDDPTAAELAQRLDRIVGQRSNQRSRSIQRSQGVRVRESTTSTQLLAVSGAGASAYCFVPLSAALPAEIGVYGFQPAGLTSRQIPDLNVAHAARRVVRAVRRVQPQGPYFLAGHSYGGHVAAAAANLLTAAGHSVQRLYLFDTVARSSTTSVADMITPVDRSAPSLMTRLRTHAQVYSAGLVQFKDFEKHQSLMWEKAIRIQNRHTTARLADFATVFVSDELAAQREYWSALAPDPDRQIIRVPGTHIGAVNDPAALEVITSRVATDLLESEK